MKVLLVCILKFLFFSYVSSESSSVPRVMCTFGGSDAKPGGYKFSVDDIPAARCDAVQLGAYFMNDPPSNTSENINDMQSLVQKGIPVYSFVSFRSYSHYAEIVDTNDTIGYEQYVTPMLTYMKKNKVNGIILDKTFLFLGKISDYASKMSKFICKMKEDFPGLKVAMNVDGDYYTSFSNKKLFDFSKTNNDVDLYIIDTTFSGLLCDDLGLKYGLLPISIPEKVQAATLDGICNSVKNSPMEQSKLMVMFSVQVLRSTFGSTSYSLYCKRNKSDSTVYCPDTIERFYDEGLYAKNYYQGILLVSLDYDDYDGSCSCGKKFPVSNAYIDGFLSAKISCCDAIS